MSLTPPPTRSRKGRPAGGRSRRNSCSCDSLVRGAKMQRVQDETNDDNTNDPNDSAANSNTGGSGEGANSPFSQGNARDDAKGDANNPIIESMQHQPAISARVPERVARGVYTTAQIVHDGPKEFVIDFMQGL